MRGGYWDGGQAYILNAAAGLSYAQRNWKMVQQLAPRALYIDTTSAVQTYQSYAPGALQHRAEDLANKTQLLKFFKKCGDVLGSEEGADFAIPYIDWCENRHVRVPGESVPLWPLVFHDAVVSARYTGDPIGAAWAGGIAGGNDYPAWLLDMLWGYAALTQLGSFDHRNEAYERMRATRHVDAWFACISTDSMDDHAFLTTDGSLERTQFSSGRSIVVNLAPEPQTYNRKPVAGHDFCAYDEHGEAMIL
jgi:hypothetical protein